MSQVLDEFAADVADRSMWALRHNGGRTNGAWSTGEQLAVALVLRDEEHLNAMQYTVAEAIQRVRDGMSNPPSTVRFGLWLGRIRAAIGFEVLP